MIKIDVSGLDELDNTIKQHLKDIEYFRAVLYNTSSIGKVFEYGSIPNLSPWQSQADETTTISDIETGATRIVSRKGFAMLRGSEKKALSFFNELLNEVTLDKPIREQIIECANKTIEYWFKLAKEATPDGDGQDKIKDKWHVKEAY